MDRRTYLKGTFGLAAGALLPAGLVGLAGCSGTTRGIELAGFDGRTMGTGYSVQYLPATESGTGAGGVAGAGSPSGTLAREIATLLDGIDASMSTYAVDSELSRLNASADTDWVRLSAPTSRVLGAALETSSATGGAFDVTVGPLVNLWGFGPEGRTTRAPAARELSRALERVGHANLELAADGSVRKRRADAYVDLSGIAKGHATDRVAEHLAGLGHESYLVEIGGELRARGRKPDGTPWRVAIERPSAGRRAVYRVVSLENAAIATSGDYRNFFDEGGQRYSHSIDPRTGRPVEHALASVSVIAPTTMEADAWSTALMIAGPETGLALAREHGLAAHLVVKSAAGLEELHTDAFARHIVS